MVFRETQSMSVTRLAVWTRDTKISLARSWVSKSCWSPTAEIVVPQLGETVQAADIESDEATEDAEARNSGTHVTYAANTIRLTRSIAVDRLMPK
jgi:hypothetical protein